LVGAVSNTAGSFLQNLCNLRNLRITPPVVVA
jgi:hypothetical protein